MSAKRRQIKYPVPPDPVEEEKQRRFAERQGERERSAGIDQDDAAGRWLEAADPEATVKEREKNKKPAPAAPQVSPQAPRQAQPDRSSSQRPRTKPRPRPAGRSGPLAGRTLLDGDCGRDGHADATIARQRGEFSHRVCIRCWRRVEA